MFTGDGSTRRGLVVRADPSNPSNAFASCYQFVIQSGRLQLSFRGAIVAGQSGVPVGRHGTHTNRGR